MLITIERFVENGIKFSYSFRNEEFSHTMEYPSSLSPTDDALFKIALFSRPENSETYEVKGIVVNESTREYFQLVLKTTIKVFTFKNPLYKKTAIKTIPEDLYLCFSGGFDSVTSKALLEGTTRLVSIDFGGAYERESHFFRKFDTNVVKWEIRGERFGQNVRFTELVDWHWMLSPALLFQLENKPLAIASGTILESAGPWWFTGFKHPDFKWYVGCGYGDDVALINPVACLTEFATTLIASRYLSNEKLKQSLESLAAPESLKAYRKNVLLSIVQGKGVIDAPEKMRRHVFGSGFTDDFMALYFNWKFGKEWVLNNYTDRLPEGVDNINMSFAEKAHKYNLDCLDADLRDHLIGRLKNFNLDMYSASDYLEIEKVKAII